MLLRSSSLDLVFLFIRRRSSAFGSVALRPASRTISFLPGVSSSLLMEHVTDKTLLYLIHRDLVANSLESRSENSSSGIDAGPR